MSNDKHETYNDKRRSKQVSFNLELQKEKDLLAYAESRKPSFSEWVKIHLSFHKNMENRKFEITIGSKVVFNEYGINQYGRGITLLTLEEELKQDALYGDDNHEHEYQQEQNREDRVEALQQEWIVTNIKVIRMEVYFNLKQGGHVLNNVSFICVDGIKGGV